MHKFLLAVAVLAGPHIWLTPAQAQVLGACGTPSENQAAAPEKELGCGRRLHLPSRM